MLPIFLLCLTAHAQVSMGTSVKLSGNVIETGLTAPVISGVTPAATQTATTIEVQFTTSNYATSTLACNTTGSPYTPNAADNGAFAASTSHQQIFAGAVASTLYYCQITATNSAGSTTYNFTSSTSAAASTTAIASLTFGTPTIISGAPVPCDTFYNAIASNGVNYFSNGDCAGWTINGSLACSSSLFYAMTVMQFTNISPIQGSAVNCLTNYGLYNGTAPDGNSAKDAGMFAMAGDLFLATGKDCDAGTSAPSGPCTSGYTTSVAGQIIWSPDFGRSWNNFQTPANFNASGNPTNATNATMFAGSPSTFGSAGFVVYGSDDGTLGYLNTYTQQDNANAYVYLVANEGYWDGAGTAGGGGNYYLARVARAKLSRLTAGDYQFFTCSPGGNGSLDSCWSSTEASASAILTNAGQLSIAAINYIPSRNRYLLLTWYYPTGDYPDTNSKNSTWLGYESPHPWGPWTQIYSQNYPTQGYYQEVPILSSGILTGLTGTVMFTHDFNNTETPYYATMTIN